eukprot:364199-Pleurochrysis_carterae.AAC.1
MPASSQLLSQPQHRCHLQTPHAQKLLHPLYCHQHHFQAHSASLSSSPSISPSLSPRTIDAQRNAVCKAGLGVATRDFPAKVCKLECVTTPGLYLPMGLWLESRHERHT